MSIPQIIGLSLVEIIGDFALKEYANNGRITQLLLGICGYIGVVIMLIISLQGSTVLLVNAAWDGMSAVVESITAYVLLGERFSNYSQYMGVCLIISGLYLLKIPWAKNHVFHIP